MIYNILDNKNVDIAIDLINQGKIIIYPTDTLYGFGVDATNSIAVNNLNKLKNRIQSYSIIVSSFDMLKEYAEFDNKMLKKIKCFLPGAYTVILKKTSNNLSNLVNLNLPTIAIRIPNSPFILDVVKKNNKPIVTTSVNSHNELSLNDVNIINEKYNSINIFSDKNINLHSKGSTIIDCTKKEFKIIRYGDGKI